MFAPNIASDDVSRDPVCLRCSLLSSLRWHVQLVGTLCFVLYAAGYCGKCDTICAAVHLILVYVWNINAPLVVLLNQVL